jgi:Mitochondrial ribosomal protein mL59
MFKGHKWERTTLAREKKRKTLMRYMKDRITKFKTVWRPIQIGSFNDALPNLSSLLPVSPSETTQSTQTRPFWEITEITILVESISGPRKILTCVPTSIKAIPGICKAIQVSHGSNGMLKLQDSHKVHMPIST